jgi:hypothetical protein
MFKEKVMMATPKNKDVTINMVLEITTYSQILDNIVVLLKEKNLTKTKIWLIGKRRKI